MGISVIGNLINKFKKNNQPLNTQRVVISNSQKHEHKHEKKEERKKEFETKLNPGAMDFSNINEEKGLEDTPQAEFSIRKVAKHGRHSRKKVNKENYIKPAVSSDLNNFSNTGKRFNKGNVDRNKKGFLKALRTLPFIFGKKSTDNNAALEFAGSNKRLGKKGRRNRQIAVYAGTGIIIIVVAFAIAFAPGSAAAPTDTEQADITQQANILEAAVVDNSIALGKGFSETDIEGGTYGGISGSVETNQTDGTYGEVESDSAGTDQSDEILSTSVPEQTAIATTPPDKTPIPINIDKVIEGFMVKADKYYSDIGYSSNHYNYTTEEFYMLAQVIQAEAGGERPEGKIAVGNVVMNRVLSKGYPGNNIKTVVTARNQFAYNSNTKPSVASKVAARQVLDYEVWVVPQNVYFFKVSRSKSNWGSHVYKFNIGAHAFYSASYYGRYKGNSIPPALFERTYKWPELGCKPENRVYRLQYMLNKLGYNVKADKYFGKDTKDAVIDFQKKKGLKADGIAGPSTIEALIYEYGFEEYYLKFCI